MPAPIHPRNGRRNVALIRLLRLMRLLREPQMLEDLADELGVTTRTVRRDIDVLREVGLRPYRCFKTDNWQLDLREGESHQ